MCIRDSLEGVVQGVTEVQRCCHVGRWDDDRVGLNPVFGVRVRIRLSVEDAAFGPPSSYDMFGLARNVDLGQFGKCVTHSDRLLATVLLSADRAPIQGGDSAELGVP